MPFSQPPPFGQVALLTRKKAVDSATRPRIVVAHAEPTIGRSIGTLLRNLGFEVVVARDLEFVNRLLPIWNPDALVVDTYLEIQEDFALSRSIAGDSLYPNFLLIAMCHLTAHRLAKLIRSVGFDGAVSGPHQTYALQSMLLNFFADRINASATGLESTWSDQRIGADSA